MQVSNSDTNTNFSKSWNISIKARELFRKPLEKYFDYNFLDYLNEEHLGKNHDDAKLTLVDDYGEFSLELKVGGHYNYGRFLNKQVVSLEAIGNVENNDLGSSMRIAKSDLFAQAYYPHEDADELELIGVYWWKPFATWFEKHWKDFKQNMTTTDGFYHTDNRLVPIRYLDFFSCWSSCRGY